MNAMYSVLAGLSAFPIALQGLQAARAHFSPPLSQNPGTFLLVLDCRQTEIAYDKKVIVIFAEGCSALWKGMSKNIYPGFPFVH